MMRALNDISIAVNSKILEQLIYAVYNLSVKEICPLLMENGVYEGKRKPAFLAQLNAIFNELSKNIEQKIMYSNRGISIDILPGSEVIEIRFEQVDCNTDYYSGKMKELGEPKGKSDYLFRWCAEFKDGKIARLYQPKKITVLSSCFMHNNDHSIN